MNHPRLYAPLRLQPGRSRLLAVFLLTIHVLALVALIPLPLEVWWKLAIVGGLLVDLGWSYRLHAVKTSGSAIVEAVWDGEGIWQLSLGNGDQVEAVLLPDSVVTLSLVVLNFRGNGRRRSLVLTIDNTDAEQLRRLRARLRVESGAKAQTDSP